ncbi:hypothetical protein D3C83_70520 [compost metagenome]
MSDESLLDVPVLERFGRCVNLRLFGAKEVRGTLCGISPSEGPLLRVRAEDGFQTRPNHLLAFGTHLKAALFQLRTEAFDIGLYP